MYLWVGVACVFVNMTAGCMCVCVCVYVCISVHKYMCVCVCVACVCVNMTAGCMCVCVCVYVCEGIYVYHGARCAMRWLRLVGSLKLWVPFAKEAFKRDYILQKRPRF